MSISLLDHLAALAGQAFAGAGVDASFGVVRFSDRPDLAQFQCNGAMSAAKAAGVKPQELAAKVVQGLSAHPDIVSASVAGPGFINIHVTDDVLARFARALMDADRIVPQVGAGKKAVLDYGGPNVAKAMHVGHLRAGIVGDTLRRLYKSAGYETLGDIHMGDWGTPMGMVIAELRRRHPEWPYFQPGFAGPYPAQSPVTMDDLEEIYPAAASACKEDEARMKEAQAATAALQNGDPGLRALWAHFRAVSIDGIKANFAALNVHFDLWKGEADVHDLIEPMVNDLRARGLAVESDGAWVVPVAREGDTKEIPPLILYKRDGAVMYGTTDLATVLERVRLYSPDKIVYCTDQRQHLHFEQVFRASRLGGLVPEDGSCELIHAGFGTMNGTDGKPFKTRAGGVMKLEDLIAMALDKAHERLKEADLAADASPQEMADIARAVALAAIRFADLKNPRHVDYVFDLDKLTSFEGKTGPYLLYQAVRIQSLLAKAGAAAAASGPLVIGDGERALVLLLCEMEQAFAGAVRDNAPHIVCDYIFRLAQQYSSFYANCPVLNEPDAAARATRLALSGLVLRMFHCILDVLGIPVPSRM